MEFSIFSSELEDVERLSGKLFSFGISTIDGLFFGFLMKTSSLSESDEDEELEDKDGFVMEVIMGGTLIWQAGVVLKSFLSDDDDEELLLLSLCLSGCLVRFCTGD